MARLLSNPRGQKDRRQDVVALAFHPNGRWLGTGSLVHRTAGNARGDGVRIWDLARGREVARLSTAPTNGILFEKGGEGLLTFDSDRLRRWPITPGEAGGAPVVSFGPPRTLLRIATPEGKARIVPWGPNPGRIALTEELTAVYLLELSPAPRVVRSWQTPTASFVASSPDGRWVATGSYEGPGFQVWDTTTHTLGRLWKGGDAVVAFSPDGRWLVSASGANGFNPAECVFWKVGTWERGHGFPLDRTSSPAQLSFSPDGRILAVERSMNEISLVDATDAAEIVRLRPTKGTILGNLRFSPDGGLLAAGTCEGTVLLWDLRKIREGLREMNLDWSISTAGLVPAPAGPEPPPVRVVLDEESLLARASYSLETMDYRRAVADLEALLKTRPGHEEARRLLAEVFSKGPVALRDNDRAARPARGDR
ncbi:MAG: WD40 repeat domain-containing protein [Isosphaeraceae bacterium]